MRVVVKIGSSSITGDAGAVDRLCDDVANVRGQGHQVVVVTSGAIADGVPALGLAQRPKDVVTLQAAAAVGQTRLMRRYSEALARHGLTAGQILLTPQNFFERAQYLQARDTLERLLELGVLPIVNENDAVSNDEIGFGDNDRLAALVANALKADLLVLLTDAAGLFTADPRHDENATLIETVREIDDTHTASAGGSSSGVGTGGMSSKLTAARMATWSGVPAVIAAASREAVVTDAVAGESVGTHFEAGARRLSARKTWIAFALPASGDLVVDEGAGSALHRGGSLLSPGVVGGRGHFEAGDAVQVVDQAGRPLGRGITRFGSAELDAAVGEVIHRDDLVVFSL